jgi:hypothetical protein
MQVKMMKTINPQCLHIAGQDYNLYISWVKDKYDYYYCRFKLIPASPKFRIPGGFKLRLLNENCENFSNNEVVAEKAVEFLSIEVRLESGEGIVWQTEPLPDDYNVEILYPYFYPS